MSSAFHILITDDDEDDCLIIGDAFKFVSRNQVKLNIASNGRQMLNFLRSPDIIEPDAIVLDINMPLMDGVEALREIRQDPKLKHLPVYILSTFRDPVKLSAVQKLGILGMFSKPNQMESYNKIVEKIINGETAYDPVF